MKKRKILAFLLVVCMAAALFLTGCGNKSLDVKEVESDPVSYLKKGDEMISEAWGLSSSQLSELLGNVMEKGQVEAGVDMTDYKLTNLLSIDGKTISNELNGTISGQDVDLMTYMDGDDVIVRSNTFLGTETTYGLKLDRFLEQGTDSNLAKALGLEEADLDEIKDMLADDSENAIEAYKQKLDTLRENIWKIIGESDIAVAEEKVKIEDTEVDAVKISVPATTEFMQSLMDEFFAKFEDVAAVSESITEMKAQMETMETMGSFDFYLNKETGALMQQTTELTSKQAGETAEESVTVTEKMDVIYGVDPASGKIEIHFTTGDDADALSIDGTLTKNTEDKKDNITLALDMDLFGQKLKFKMEGTASVTKDAAEFGITSIKVDDVTVDTNISIKLTTKATMPEKPEYEDLLALDEDSLNELIANAYLSMIMMDSGDYYYDETACEFCDYNEATQEVSYLGESWRACDDCAKEVAEVIAGNYCDMCWTETTDLTVVEEDGVAYRFCPDCYEAMGLDV